MRVDKLLDANFSSARLINDARHLSKRFSIFHNILTQPFKNRICAVHIAREASSSIHTQVWSRGRHIGVSPWKSLIDNWILQFDLRTQRDTLKQRLFLSRVTHAVVSFSSRAINTFFHFSTYFFFFIFLERRVFFFSLQTKGYYLYARVCVCGRLLYISKQRLRDAWKCLQQLLFSQTFFLLFYFFFNKS